MADPCAPGTTPTDLSSIGSSTPACQEKTLQSDAGEPPAAVDPGPEPSYAVGGLKRTLS